MCVCVVERASQITHHKQTNAWQSYSVFHQIRGYKTAQRPGIYNSLIPVLHRKVANRRNKMLTLPGCVSPHIWGAIPVSWHDIMLPSQLQWQATLIYSLMECNKYVFEGPVLWVFPFSATLYFVLVTSALCIASESSTFLINLFYCNQIKRTFKLLEKTKLNIGSVLTQHGPWRLTRMLKVPAASTLLRVGLTT